MLQIMDDFEGVGNALYKRIWVDLRDFRCEMGMQASVGVDSLPRHTKIDACWTTRRPTPSTGPGRTFAAGT